MEISATVRNVQAQHEVTVRTGEAARPLAIPAKPTGGSAVMRLVS